MLPGAFSIAVAGFGPSVTVIVCDTSSRVGPHPCRALLAIPSSPH